MRSRLAVTELGACPVAPTRQVQVPGRRTSQRSGAPSLSDAVLAALVALADVLVLGLLALLVA